jgi:DNA mismatch repair ATPase MutS
VFKPLIERLSNPGFQTVEIDPALLAASFGFGAISQPNIPLPETPAPQRRIANPSDISLIDSHAKKPAPKPSLFSIVMARLESLTPLSKEHESLVTGMKAKVIPELTAIDSFVAEIEEARFIAIEVRWEEVRTAGRKLIDSMPTLQRELAEARGYCNQSESAKVRTQTAAEQLFHARIALNKSVWASKAELKDADQKLERAKDAAVKAKQLAFDDVRRMAVVESKIANVHATLESYQAELQRLALELSGEAHFDSEFGLSSEAKFYTEEQVSGGQR